MKLYFLFIKNQLIYYYFLLYIHNKYIYGNNFDEAKRA
jgi:hypothetical protein